MPLRVRLITLVGLALLASLAFGSVLVCWHEAMSVQTELRAALLVGAQTIRGGLDDLARAEDRARDLRRLIRTFDGNRHVRATLLNERDESLAISEPSPPTHHVPDWFRDLIGGATSEERVAVPRADGGGTIVLRAEPINEVGEGWAEARDAVLVLAGFALLTAALVGAFAGRALRPLETLSSAFHRIGNGDYYSRVPEHGPLELVRLARGFNLMVQRLGTIAMQNRRLNERLLTLQAEERAELARDLHDEVGPLLFAVEMASATIERVEGTSRASEIPMHVGSIHDAVGQVQRHVRTILERLRPLQAIGLELAIDRLVAFWSSRHADIGFTATVPEDADQLGDDVKETIYRVVQEAVSNAVRHGMPARVDIVVERDGDGFVRVEVSDDGIGMAADGNLEHGSGRLGLIGMRERVMAMAGSLSVQHGRDGKGLTVVARLPWDHARQRHEQDALE